MKLNNNIKKLFQIPGNFLFISIFILIPTILCCQPEGWDIRYYSTDDGLSSNHVNCFIKDSKGFLWVGTNRGLNRFDGYNFKKLILPDGQLHPLSNSKILSIIEDWDKILWVGTRNGLYRYDPSAPLSEIQKYEYFTQSETDSLYMEQPVNSLFEDRNGRLWMSCIDLNDWINYGVRSFDRETGTFTYEQIDSSFNATGYQQNDAFVLQIGCDRDSALWMGTSSGICKYDEKSGTFECYTPVDAEGNNLYNQLGFFFEDKKNNFWVSSRFGFYSFDPTTTKFSQLKKLHTFNTKLGEHSSIYAFAEDGEGYLWMINETYLTRTRVEEGGGIDLSTTESWEIPSQEYSLNSIKCLLVENPETAWLSAYGIGLCQVHIKRKKFRTIEPAKVIEHDQIVTNLTGAVYIDPVDKNLWFATIDSGVIRYDQQKEEAEYYIPCKIEGINSIQEDQHQNLWFASRYGVASRLIRNSSGKVTFRQYDPDPENPLSLTMRNDYLLAGIADLTGNLTQHILFKDQYGNLWFNSGRGIHDLYNPELDGFIHLDHRHIDYFNNDTCLTKEVDGEIWMPSERGLLRLLPPFQLDSTHNMTPAHVVCYRNEDVDSFCLNSSNVRTVFVSKVYNPGTIWLGTYGGGLNRLEWVLIEGTDRYEIHFRSYTISDGLCDNYVTGILEDGNGNLWLGTANGLSRFDPRSETFFNYYRDDGLPSDQYAWFEPFKSKEGKMYFPSEFGLLVFHPDSIQDNPYIPPVVITEIRLFNQPVTPGEESFLKNDISYTSALSLPYNKNFLSFEFAGLNYEYPEKNQYRYQLEGLDRDWVYSGSRRYAEYTGLRHGKYTFRVQASNNDGLWNDNGATMEITIHPPPWLTYWAYAAYLFLAVITFLLIRQFYTNRARLHAQVELEKFEKEKVMELEQMKSRFFTNISHEFRTPLSLILDPLKGAGQGSSRTVTMKREIIHMMQRNAIRLQRLINQILDISKVESGKIALHVSVGNLERFCKRIILSFSSFAESKMIDLKYELEENNHKVFFDPDKLEKILSNLISNAIKFTPSGGEVTVVLRYRSPEKTSDPERAEIEVSDSGPGIPPDKQEKIFDRYVQLEDHPDGGTGIGLALIRELLEVYRGNIELISEVGKGSRFIVDVPVTRAAFEDSEIQASDEEEPEDGNDNEETYHEQPLASVPDKSDPADINMVLIVEDNADLRNYISMNLKENYQILMAGDGKEGLEKSIEYLPDLVISDVMMPEMDGIELLNRLKNDERTNHIPVILLTAKAERENKIEGLVSGADAYIIKPFDSEELTVQVSNLIQQRKALKNKFLGEFLPGGDLGKYSEDPLFSRLVNIIYQHISDPEFNVDQLAYEISLGRSQLYRKVESVTGGPPGELIQIIRIKHASRLLLSKEYNITQVMLQIGMQSHSHFTRTFRKYFGINPSEYRKINARD